MLRVLALQASHTVEHGRGMNRVYRQVMFTDLQYLALQDRNTSRGSEV